MKKILFLCTGNTCRSPMAECLFNRLSAEKGLDWRAISAGIAAHGGEPASGGAHAAMKARGLSLQEHRAQPLRQELLSDVSLIYAMTESHGEACYRRFPGLSIPIRSFSPAIPDPFGGSLQTYEKTASALEAQLSALISGLARQDSPNP